MREKCPYLELFWSVFSRTWTEYGETEYLSEFQSKCGKIRTTETSNMDTFHEVSICRSRNPTFHFVPTFPKYNLQRNIFVVRIFRSYTWKRTVSLESAGCMFSFTMQPKSNISFLLFFFFSFFFLHIEECMFWKNEKMKKNFEKCGFYAKMIIFI